MSISRNDACPCGSGKKYKKCCLNKQSIIQVQEVKEERFYQQRQLLFLKLQKFIEEKAPLNRYLQLKNQFIRRTNNHISSDVQDRFIQFWLQFCHRYENGLRGIEWFFQEQGAKLSPNERALTENWTKLRLRLIQAIDKREDTVIFEDVITKEHLPVIDSRENIPEFTPWYSTIGLLEEFEEVFYFNGVRIFKGPNELMQALNFVRELGEKENKAVNDILFDFYPEILSVFVQENYGLSKEDMVEKEINEYTVQYQVIDGKLLNEFIEEHEDFVVHESNEILKRLSWTSNWKLYSDSELSEEIQIADVLATIVIENGKLTFHCFDLEHKAALTSLFNEAKQSIKLVDEKQRKIKIPFNAIIKNSFVQMSENTPQYFSVYAQNVLASAIDTPLPKYGNRSIRQLVADNKIEEAESWLRQMERNIYQHAVQKYKEVAITPDANSIRRELGLPLSPYVTGGDKRVSAVKLIDNPFKKQETVSNEELSFYETLGFTLEISKQEYAKDFVEFFKEKTTGKGDATIRKYRNSLAFLRGKFEAEQIQNWHECKEVFWTKVIAQQIIGADDLSKSFQKDILSTVKAFSKWIDQKYQLDQAKMVNEVINTSEKQLVNA